MNRLDEDPLSLEAFEELTRAPLDDTEREEYRQLIAWFTRRYPTAKERLAYVRRKYAELRRPCRIESSEMMPFGRDSKP